MNIPPPPKPPLARHIRPTTGGICPKCNSSMMNRRFFFFGATPGCIHPKCENYGGAIK